MKNLKFLWIGIFVLFLGFCQCTVKEKSQTDENFPSDFNKYEALRFSGGQEIFSPEKIITADNNWEILLSCRDGKTREELHEVGIDFTESQLMLLKAMGFLDFRRDAEPEKLITTLPILGSSDKQALINKVRELAAKIEPELRDDLKKLKEILAKSGYNDYLFSIFFSAVIDGIVWFPFIDQGFVNEFSLDHERPLFDGVYWLSYPKRDFRCGSNIAIGDDVFMILNWSDGPMNKIQEVFHWNNLYSMRDQFLEYGKIVDEELKSELITYGVVDDEGNFIVPIIEIKANDEIFLICSSMAEKIVDFMSQNLNLDNLRQEFGFADKEKAFVVTYHEWMWELVELLDEKGLIKKPLAFSNPEKALPKDIGKLFFIIKGVLPET